MSGFLLAQNDRVFIIVRGNCLDLVMSIHLSEEFSFLLHPAQFPFIAHLLIIGGICSFVGQSGILIFIAPIVDRTNLLCFFVYRA